MAMLLASPVAWSHHWVWAVPVALVLWERRRWAAVAWTLVFVARPVVWPPYGEGRELDWTPAQHLAGHSYLLAALAFAAWAAVTLRRSSGQELAEREYAMNPSSIATRRVEQVADPVRDE